MEEETEEQRESKKSGTTSTQVDTQAENCSELQIHQEPEEDDQAQGGDCDGEGEPNQVGKDLCTSDTETSPQESVIGTNTQDDADPPPVSPVFTEVEVTPPTVSPDPSNTQTRAPAGAKETKKCWIRHTPALTAIWDCPLTHCAGMRVRVRLPALGHVMKHPQPQNTIETPTSSHHLTAI
ncbi:hypothetical protein Q5P01_019687 [Channa striata]|uniref:Uncharacterized protein n=1 Tax=Channa striata TaxID=64152 RepID=A0AA88M2T9_CHASR|nr:hypothetical protein Q5P01_019687 [Channa striata]